MARQQPRKVRPSNDRRANDQALTLGLLEKDSIERGQQLEATIKKIDELVEKFHELTLNMTKMLTAHDSQIQELKSRMSETSVEVDEQARELAASKAQFIEAVKEVAKELAAQNLIAIGVLQERVNKLENWRNKILGALAVITALSFLIDGPELMKRIFG
jgi:hypothetical protein